MRSKRERESRGRSQLLVKQVTGHSTLCETVGLGGRGKVAVAKKSDFKNLKTLFSSFSEPNHPSY